MKRKNLRFVILILFFVLLTIQIINIFEYSRNLNGISVKIRDLNVADSQALNFIKFDTKVDNKIGDFIQSKQKNDLIPVIIVLSEQPKIPQDIKERSEITNLARKQILGSQNLVKKIIMEECGIINHSFSVINAISAKIKISTINKLLKMESIARIEYDYVLKASISDSVPAIKQDPPYTTWNSSLKGSGVVVAILDTGINENHPALKGRVVDRYNALDGSSNVADDDASHSHGSRVAGIINSNDTYSTGVAPEASLVIVKVFDNTGSGPSSWLMAGAEWAATRANPKPDIINFSGGITTTEAEMQNDGQSSLSFFVDAITSQYNILWINAAGNIDGDQLINLPADSYNCIAVGALNNLGTITRIDDSWASSYSSYGPTNDGRIKPEVVAPGTLINSTLRSGSSWGTDSGTSFSAPHVTGAAAVIEELLNENFSIEKKYYPLVVKSLLIHTAVDWKASGLGPGSDGIDSNTGFGYISLPRLQYFANHGYIYGKTLSSYYVDYRVPYYYNVTLQAGVPFNLTLVWNRHASYNAPYVYYYGNGVPNDINVYLLNKNGVIVANSTDDKNNIEQLSYIPTSSDYYYLKIGVEGTLQYAAEEYYGLVCSTELKEVNLNFIVSFYENPVNSFDINYYFYNFLSSFLPIGSYNLNERIKMSAITSGETSFLNGTISFGSVTENMTRITSHLLEYNTIPLSNLIPTESIMSAYLSGVRIQFQMVIYDNKTPQSYLTRDFEIVVHGFLHDIIPPLVIVLVVLIVVDYFREKRVKGD
ncbi:MAG: S8 family peptidase [Candidatus Helarchaeota archaeon]